MIITINPWVKYYSMNDENQLTNFNDITLEDKIILNPISGYCMYSKKICTNYKIENKLKIKKLTLITFFIKIKTK